jgi:hypothetical protein
MNHVIQEAFVEAVKGGGFHEYAGSWYLDGAEATLVVNLQKSTYGDQYYVNLAVWDKSLGEVKFPKEHKCHVRLRLGSLVGGDAVRCFDGEDQSLDNATRRVLIKAVMEQHAIPLLKPCVTRDGIKRRIAEGAFKKGFVHFQILGILK